MPLFNFRGVGALNIGPAAAGPAGQAAAALILVLV